MVKLRADTGELQQTSGKFSTKATELEGLIKQAQAAMNQLEASWEGPRKNKTFNEWQSMQRNLKAAVDTLQATSKFLKQAQIDYETVENV